METTVVRHQERPGFLAYTLIAVGGFIAAVAILAGLFVTARDVTESVTPQPIYGSGRIVMVQEPGIIQTARRLEPGVVETGDATEPPEAKPGKAVKPIAPAGNERQSAYCYTLVGPGSDNVVTLAHLVECWEV